MQKPERSLLPFLCALAIQLMAGGCAHHVESAAAEPTATSGRKLFSQSIVPLPKEPGFTPQGLMVEPESPDKDKTLELLFSLELPRQLQLQLDEKVAKGETVSPEEFKRDYSPPQDVIDKLEAWLRGQGFEVIYATADRTSVYARASVAQIETSLQVEMVRVFEGGTTYTAARNAPSLPADVGAGVSAIIGLQPFRHANKHGILVVPESPPMTARVAADSEVAASVGNHPGYNVQEILNAYGAANLSITGTGQEIAILIDTLPDVADVNEFWKENGHPPADMPKVDLLNIKGGVLPPQQGEETLDVEWATGVAPGARVRVYASGSLSFVDLDRALDKIFEDVSTHPKMRQMSISLGLGETFMAPAEVRTQHSKFSKLAAAGVNVFVSSGDAGSTPDATGHHNLGPLQAEYESSDPSVIGVGGTTLRLDANGNVVSETAWPGSGGGRSKFQYLGGRPIWQKGTGVPQGNDRLVPDVSLVADPNTGALVILRGGKYQYGGTSWSAPAWSGFCALINEAREKAHKPALPFLNTAIYPLMNTKIPVSGPASRPENCFRDIIRGSNGKDGKYNAGAGYDLVTGLGVPNLRALLAALAGPPAP